MKTNKIVACAMLSAGLMFNAHAQNWNGGGVPNVDLWRDGNVGIGMFGPPTYKLELDNGDFNIRNGFGIKFDGIDGFRPVSPGSNDFILGNGGRIGVGITPTHTLDVNGIVNSTGGYLINNIPALMHVGSLLFQTPGYLGVGMAPSYRLDVNGDINMGGTDAFRIGGGKFLWSRTFCTYLGAGAGIADAGTNNTFLGFGTGPNNNTGIDNTFVGTSAGNANTTGSSNAYFGTAAGQNGSAGSGNTLIGQGCGVAVENNSNTAVGHIALHNGKYGVENAVLGNWAMAGNAPGSASYNTVMGNEAGKVMNTGDHNVLIGWHSGSMLDGYDRNTFVGGRTDGRGNENVIMGYRGGVGSGDFNTIVGARTLASGTISTALGYGADVASNNTMALGGVAGSGNEVTVVIGQNVPVGLGGTQIGASMGFSALEVNGDILSQGALWFNSDKRFKKDIKDISSAGDLLRKLHPVSYTYRDDMHFNEVKGSDKKVNMNLPKGEQIGFLAQELEEVMPDAVKTRTDGYKAVNYNHFFGLLVKGYQEHDETIENELKKSERLQSEIDMIKEQNRLQMQAIENLEARLSAYERNDAVKTTETKTAYLEQNSPNPFNENTVLKYFVPENTNGAKIVIRSSDAIEVMSFDVVHKGHGNIIVSGNSLTTGTYTCELYIGSKMVDMKRMLLVK